MPRTVLKDFPVTLSSRWESKAVFGTGELWEGSSRGVDFADTRGVPGILEVALDEEFLSKRATAGVSREIAEVVPRAGVTGVELE